MRAPWQIPRHGEEGGRAPVAAMQLQTVAHITLTVVVLFCIVSVNYRTITTPWFTMTEEFPYVQEVLRFLSGDFRQHFFDIPGTPFIAVVTAICALILGVVSLVSGQVSSLAALGFAHLDLVYLVMRCVSLGAFAVATWLVFLPRDGMRNRGAE
jgi:hypothetical protein